MISRINEWIDTDTKTIAYFPYASYAGDALRGIKVALYTGRNLEDVSAAALAERKRKALLISGGSDKIASIAAAIPGTGFSGKGKIVLKHRRSH